MLRRILSRRPSPAMIVAIVALIVATAGGAYAVTVPKKSVGPKQLKANAVKTKKIANGAVTNSKLGSGAVTGTKLGSVIVRKVEVQVPNNDINGATASCQGSEKMIGGGARFVNSGSRRDLLLISSGPRKLNDNAAPDEGGPLEAWRGAGVNEGVGVPNDTPGDFPFTVFAICLQ